MTDDERAWVVHDMTLPDNENPAFGPMTEAEARRMESSWPSRWAQRLAKGKPRGPFRSSRAPKPEEEVSALRARAITLLASRFTVYGTEVSDNDEARLVAALEDEVHSPALARARDALRVVAYDLRTVEWMRPHDPMGLRQVTAALPEFEEVDPRGVALVAGDEGFEGVA